MAYSFRGHTFQAALPGMFMPMVPPPQAVEDRSHIPYSDINYVDDAGDQLNPWQLTIYCTPAERSAILADRGLIGTLVTPDGTYANTKLSQIRAVGVLLDRTQYSLEVEFLVG